MFYENGNAALPIEPLYDSISPRAPHSRCLSALLQKDIRSCLGIAQPLIAANGGRTLNTLKTQDEVGNLTGYDDGTTSASYAYDANNRKTGETVNYGPFAKSYAYTYTPNGQKATFTGPDGQIVRYGYDANNQLNSIELPVGAMVVNSYAWRAPGKWTLPGGVTQERQYDPLLRPTGIRVRDQAGNTLIDYLYTYDDAGNIATKQSEHGRYDYSYDALNRLVQADNPTLADEAYTYDGVGNRTTDTNRPGAWNYSTGNRLTGIGSQTGFTYDANGSLVQKTDNGTTTDYQYNRENRLSRISRNGSTVASYGYDPFGRRLWKEAGGQRIYFLYSEEGLVAEFDNSGTIIRAYGYESDGVWGTDPVYQKTGGQYYFYQNDHLGTPQKLVGTNGAVVWSAKYRAFGEALLDGSYAVENPLRFPGQYYDSETGLHYNGRRYFDPLLGRFITSDPIGLDANTLNTYAYVDNNPINWFDPNGLEKRGRNRSRPRGPGVDTSACSYYSEACSKYGCGYYCYWAPLICRTADYNPLFKRDPTATTQNLNCVRKCLVREDKKKHDEKAANCQDGCLTDEEIDAYHTDCFRECGINPEIYPGVGIFN